MSDAEALYRYIEREAAPFAEKVRVAAQSSLNEAEFSDQVAHDIKNMADDLGVELHSRKEYSLATGRADAVYNRLIIEYEPPGSLRPDTNHRHTAHAIKQVEDYIGGLAERERHDQSRLLGVAFDGHYYIFVRYRDGNWYVEPPLEVGSASTARFLRSLFSLSSGRALIPENLVEDFGAGSPDGRRATRALYHALEGHEDDLVGKLFQQWQLFFSEVSGYDEATDRLRDKKELRDFARGMGLQPEQTDPPRLFFAIHTYFSFLVKAIARLVLEWHARQTLNATPLTTLAGSDDETLHRELGRMETGDIFRTLGLQNLLEGDFFSWYLHSWEDEVADALRQTLSSLADYNPATVQDDPYAARDLLKKLYHYLLPRELRHDLGEYYTPDWLAERVLTQLNEPLFRMPGPEERPPRRSEGRRLLDPACGSGTFLILAIRAFKEHCLRQGKDEAETLEVILNDVVGIDLNPLAVLAARVNYLLAVAELLPYRRDAVEIPVYLADSIMVPTGGESLLDTDRLILKTVVGDLAVPEAVDTRPEMEALMNTLEEYVRGEFSTDAFLGRVRPEIEPMSGVTEDVLRELYERLTDLEDRGLDGIWTRVMKNAFMPLFMQPFDYVVGNPPWVNWESLPDGYRRDTAGLWQDYGLFVHSGMDTILGKGKKDISTLMTYAVADRFLEKDGRLAFVITQSVFKTAGAGQGFRRFQIGQNGEHLRAVHVDDMSELQPFEGASNRTAVVMLQKGRATAYPLPYTYWKKTARGKLNYESTLAEIEGLTSRFNFHALPVSSGDPTSPWLTARRKALDAVRKVLGPSDYEAHAGVYSGGANAVYWLEVVAERPDGLLVVSNLTKGARRRVESVTDEIEPDLVYPLLRGKDVRRWQASPSARILMVQDPQSRRGIEQETLQRDYPKTWSYLKHFEKELRQRAAFKRYFTRKDKGGGVVETGSFYSMFNVGGYTLAPWKVVWREQTARFTCTVVGPDQGSTIMPDHKLMLVACGAKEEAYYLAGVLNSGPAELTIRSYAISIQQDTHITQNICVPNFDSKDPTHNRLAELSERAHELAPAAYEGNEKAREELGRLEGEIDEATAELWKLTGEELEEIKRSLEELQK